MFIKLHHATTDDWYVAVEHIAAIHVAHDKEDPRENGTDIYLAGDPTPIGVMERPEEIRALLVGAMPLP